MDKDFKYPIQFAVLELKEKGGWSVGYEDIINGYIASKCYVLGTNIIYNPDGTYSVFHQVVFPYNDITAYKNSLKFGKQSLGKERVPSYDAWHKPNPTTLVEGVFDSYEYAKAIAEQKNETLRYKAISELSLSTKNWQDKVGELKKEIAERISMCNMYEQLVLQQTSCMKVTDLAADDIETSVTRTLNK